MIFVGGRRRSTGAESASTDMAAEARLGPMITTRPATGDDAAAIAYVHVRSWQVAYDGIIPAGFLAALDPDARAEQWRRNLTESASADGIRAPTNMVAVIDGEVAGFACVGRWRESVDNATHGELWAMYVHPDRWGTGAGHALMNDTIALFLENGVETAHLWVLEENDRARRFYERQGWEVDDVTRADTIGGIEVTERRYSMVLGGRSSHSMKRSS